jgi:hypothetical protein
VAAPIRIGALDAIEASDLAQALGARGLTGQIVETEGVRWVVIEDSREETDRLLAEVAPAVMTWLDEHGRETIEVHVEARVLTLSPHADMRDLLRSRVPASGRRSGPRS